MNMKRKLTALLLLLALLLSLTACGDAAQTIDTVQQAAQTVQEIAAAQEEETPAIEEDGTYTTKEDVARYIYTYGHLPGDFIAKKQVQALGWEADPVTETAQEIVIPRVFSGVFSDYNALQKQQGFDLSTYAGETCTAYTYRVTNYEGSTDTVLAQLFVYRNRVIGGDIHATAMDGFMHGLR